MSDRLREQIEQWRDKEKLEASRHTSSQWIWGNHMSAAKAYEKVLAALAEKPAERPAPLTPHGEVINTYTPVSVPLAEKSKEELVRIVEMMSEDMQWYVAERNRLLAERPQLSALPNVDELAAMIRRVDPDHETGAGIMAERLLALLTGEAEKVLPVGTRFNAMNDALMRASAAPPAAPPVFQAEPDVERVPTHMERARDLTVLYDLRCERIDDPDPDWLAEEMAKEFVEVEKVAFARAAQEAENFYHKGTAIANIIRALADSPVSGDAAKEKRDE